MESAFIGKKEEQEYFATKYENFLSRLPHLNDAVSLAFAREKLALSETVDKLVFSLGMFCADDFQEILLLCENGFGSGAQKLLRGLYERAITAHYLHEHPDEAEFYADYSHVHNYKLLRNWREVTKGVDQELDEALRNAKSRYEAVKKKFEITKCKKCGTKRINDKWTKLDFVTMAKAVQEWGDPMFIIKAYREPTAQIHATMDAVLERTARTPEQGIQVGQDRNFERKKARSCLSLSYAILIGILDLQVKHFGLSDLIEPLLRCGSDFAEIFPENDQATKSPPQ